MSRSPFVRKTLPAALLAALLVIGFGLIFSKAQAPEGGGPTGAGGSGVANFAGELVVGLRADPESLDPYFVYHPSGFAVMEALYDSLLMADEQGDIAPHLASGWDVVDDVTIDFTLRTDVVFHDGRPFDGRAVQYSIERVLDPDLQSGLRSDYEAIDRVEVLTPHRVRLHLTRPDSSLLWRLTELAIVAPRRDGDPSASEVVGTGPFRLVERVRDRHVIVEANPRYFEGAKPGPGVSRVVFRVIPEDSTRVAELRTGGVHLVEQVPVDMTPLVLRSGMKTVPADTGRFFVAWFAADQGGPLADPRVRRALNYAVDAEAAIRFMLQGYASPIAAPFAEATLGFDGSISPYPYDPARAKQLLAEAGYEDGFSLTLDTTANRATEAQLVAGLLKEIGVDVTVRPLEASVFNTNWTTKTTGDLILASWGGAGDPQRYLELLVKSDGFLSRYANPQADELLEKSGAELDPVRRRELLRALQRVLRDDPPALYLWSAADIYGVSPLVQGWRPRPTERLIVAGIRLVDGADSSN